MVDWKGRKPCAKRFECVAQGKSDAAVAGIEYPGLSTEVCSSCQDYAPDIVQLHKRAKFF